MSQPKTRCAYCRRWIANMNRHLGASKKCRVDPETARRQAWSKKWDSQLEGLYFGELQTNPKR